MKTFELVVMGMWTNTRLYVMHVDAEDEAAAERKAMRLLEEAGEPEKLAEVVQTADGEEGEEVYDLLEEAKEVE